MDRKANTLDQAKELFGTSTEPVLCEKDGKEPVTCNNVDEAEKYFEAD